MIIWWMWIWIVMDVGEWIGIDGIVMGDVGTGIVDGVAVGNVGIGVRT